MNGSPSWRANFVRLALTRTTQPRQFLGRTSFVLVCPAASSSHLRGVRYLELDRHPPSVSASESRMPRHRPVRTVSLTVVWQPPRQ